MTEATPLPPGEARTAAALHPAGAAGDRRDPSTGTPRRPLPGPRIGGSARPGAAGTRAAGDGAACQRSADDGSAGHRAAGGQPGAGFDRGAPQAPVAPGPNLADPPAPPGRTCDDPPEPGAGRVGDGPPAAALPAGFPAKGVADPRLRDAPAACAEAPRSRARPGAGPGRQAAVAPADLDRLMPLHARLDAEGRILGAGPTLRKMAGLPPMGRHLAEIFVLMHPSRLESACDLTQVAPLRLTLRAPSATPFRGVAVPLSEPAGGVLLNLSLSYGLREAVREHDLTGTDFAATDLAFELLFLAEANGAVMAEASRIASRLRGARLQALEQALTDPLTGLRNRRGFDRALERLGAAGQPFGLIHVDLDHFKAVNDRYGHLSGDRVLVAMAHRLRNVVRDADAVARIGGDEFVVLLPGLRDRAAIEPVAARLLAALSAPLGGEVIDPSLGPAPPVSASLGVVVWTGPGVPVAEALLKESDRALYRSKDGGRGRFTLLEPSRPARPDPPG